jgi:hypothetical protein
LAADADLLLGLLRRRQAQPDEQGMRLAAGRRLARRADAQVAQPGIGQALFERGTSGGLGGAGSEQ